MCLPVACQRDPANVRRIRKVPAQRLYDTQTVYPAGQMGLARRHSVSSPAPLDKKTIKQQIEDTEFERYLMGEDNMRENLVNKVFKYARTLKPKVIQYLPLFNLKLFYFIYI